MEPAELLIRVARVLERMGLPYAVGGSMASMRYGEPRFTNDIDIVVDLPAARVDELASYFPDSDYYLSPDAARHAIRHRSQFNIIHPDSGLKVDLILPPADQHGSAQLARSQEAEVVPGERVQYSAPEDVIVRKLLYYREGGSEKHLRDIASMLAISGSIINRDEVARWATDLGVEGVWSDLLAALDSK